MALRFFAGSLILHITIVLLMFCSLTKKSSGSSDSVEIHFLSAVENFPRENLSKASVQKMPEGKFVSHHYSVSDFSPQRLSLKKIESRAESDRDDWTQSQNYSSNSLTDFENMEVWQVRFLRSLWNEVDKSIVDSPYLSEYGHIGKVYFKFDINSDGHIVENSLHAIADDNVLKVFAARALRKALKNENRELVLPLKTLSMKLQFSWSDYESCHLLQGSHQNYLSFCKYAEDQRKKFSAAEKTATYLKALNYGFGAIEEIKKYQQQEHRKNTGFDPFEDLRRDPDWNLGA